MSKEEEKKDFIEGEVVEDKTKKNYGWLIAGIVVVGLLASGYVSISVKIIEEGIAKRF